ncbi:MAG: HPr family phosphocarrier protein, partial [Fimbriiglobus sp.]
GRGSADDSEVGRDAIRGHGGTPGMGTNGPIRRTVTVANPLGLHMRPATVFAQAARAYRSAVTVWNGDRRADGKSPLDLILLVALPDAELTLEVDGDDAETAVEPLIRLLADPGDGLM